MNGPFQSRETVNYVRSGTSDHFRQPVKDVGTQDHPRQAVQTESPASPTLLTVLRCPTDVVGTNAVDRVTLLNKPLTVTRYGLLACRPLRFFRASPFRAGPHRT